MTRKKFPNSKDAAREAGLLLSKQKGQILFLSSGGSALSILDSIDRQVAKNWTIGVVDDRHDGPSNFEALVKKLHVAQHVIHPDQDFEKNLRLWKKNNPTGQIVVTLGIGPDGHTAGIMVDQEEQIFDDPKRWVVGYEAQGNHEFRRRTTTTFSFLRMVDLAIVYVCGDQKRAALEKTLAPTGNLTETPARIIHDIGRVFLFTDLLV